LNEGLQETLRRVSLVGEEHAVLDVHRTVVDREHHGIAPAQRHHLGPRLHAWPLLGQHEFAAGEILFRLRQQNRHLQRKDMLAVEILVESVVVARGVLQQERRWPRLPRLVAARDEIGMRVRVADIDPHRLVPAIGDRRQVRIDRPAKIGNDVRQRIREVLVFTPPEPVPRARSKRRPPMGSIFQHDAPLRPPEP